MTGYLRCSLVARVYMVGEGSSASHPADQAALHGSAQVLWLLLSMPTMIPMALGPTGHF